jgi:hypothetical protein
MKGDLKMRSEVVALLEMAERTAAEKFDGHITFLRFPTGWKVVFGTPMISAGDYRQIGQLEGGMSLKKALLLALPRSE